MIWLPTTVVTAAGYVHAHVAKHPVAWRSVPVARWRGTPCEARAVRSGALDAEARVAAEAVGPLEQPAIPRRRGRDGQVSEWPAEVAGEGSRDVRIAVRRNGSTRRRLNMRRALVVVPLSCRGNAREG
jgi:hypothetical protein